MYVTSRRPVLPPRLAAAIREAPWVEYLQHRVGAAATAAVERALLRQPAAPHNDGTWTGRCTAAAVGRGTYSAGQVATAYGLTAMNRATTAADARIGIVGFGEGPDAASSRAAERCWGWTRLDPRVRLSLGMTSPWQSVPAAFSEPDLDWQTVRGLLPQARHITYYETYEDYSTWWMALAGALVDPQRPDVLSVSYDWAERSFARSPTASLFDAMALRLSLLGTSVFVAAGDDGSACQAGKRCVDWPTSLPFVTSVGGTRLALDRTNRRVAETGWNDFPWLSAANAGGATSGGMSHMYSRPWWQPRAVVRSSMRSVPDVSAHASRLPGWPVALFYSASQGTWTVNSGTSASTPLVAAEFAVIAASLRTNGHRGLGLVTPALYALGPGGGSFYDVVRGTNSVPGQPRGYAAAPGYDRASGLGVPQFAVLQRALAVGK